MDFSVDIEHLYTMLGYVREEASASGLNPESLHRIELMAEEALVNVISYAYRPEEKKNGGLSIVCGKTEDGHFQVTIRDRGVPFNPLEAETAKDIDKPLDERKIGGLGIYMIRKLADQVSYDREGEENVFRMAVRL